MNEHEPGCQCPNCFKYRIEKAFENGDIGPRERIEIVPVPMPAKVELKGLLPLLDKLRGNPDKMEALGLELQMVIDRYTEEVEKELQNES